VLGVRDHRGLLGVGRPFDAEELLLKRAAVIEREDVELAVVAKCHAADSIAGASGGASWPLRARRGAPRMDRYGPPCGFVRSLPAVWSGGQPLRDRVSLRRPPFAPARAEAATRARATQGPPSATYSDPRAGTAAPRRDRRPARRIAAIRDGGAGAGQLRDVG